MVHHGNKYHMRQFINIIESFGTSQTLYHGTSIDAAWLIMKKGFLDADYNGRSVSTDEPMGVSLTRDYQVAKNFAANATDSLYDSFFDYFNLGTPPKDFSGVVFAFDRNKIQQEIIDFDDFGDGSEHEERVMGNLPIEPSLENIFVNAKDVSYFLQKAVEVYNRRAGEGQEYNKEFRSIIEGMLKDPRLRAL